MSPLHYIFLYRVFMHSPLLPSPSDLLLRRVSFGGISPLPSITPCGLSFSLLFGEISPDLGVTVVRPSGPHWFGKISPVRGVLSVRLGCPSVSCGISLFSIVVLSILITVLASLSCLCASACSLSILTGSCNESHRTNCSPSGRPWLLVLLWSSILLSLCC